MRTLVRELLELLPEGLFFAGNWWLPATLLALAITGAAYWLARSRAGRRWAAKFPRLAAWAETASTSADQQDGARAPAVVFLTVLVLALTALLLVALSVRSMLLGVGTLVVLALAGVLLRARLTRLARDGWRIVSASWSAR